MIAHAFALSRRACIPISEDALAYVCVCQEQVCVYNYVYIAVAWVCIRLYTSAREKARRVHAPCTCL
eukprot:4889999-Pleurochrysis_carterae.AAC.1